METEEKIPSLRRGSRIKKLTLKALENKDGEKQLEDLDNYRENYFASEDSTSEESDYSSSEDSSSSGDNDSISSVEEDAPPSKIFSENFLSKTSSTLKQQRKNKSSSYIIRSEDYFSHNTSKKNKTSNNTLDNLKKSRMSQNELRKLVSELSFSDNHKNAVNELSKQNKADFIKWLYLLQDGFNILLYGLGSKREILNKFREECLNTMPVVVVNGFFPSLTVKDILDSIIINILELKENPANLFQAADVIITELSALSDIHLYIIIHNMEGEMLRTNPKTQAVLAKLAAAKNIHLIASIDHINTPLIWDHKKVSKFNFTWWDVTSFKPYINETSFEKSLLVNSSGSLALSSLRNVFLSLTSNSKGIYLLIAKYQINRASTQYYQGMSFKDLYSSCREAFLVSSDLALRAQLTEFVDHKMIKFKRSADGTENLIIPLSNNLLQQFINNQ